MYIWIDFDEMNLYSRVVLLKNAVVTTRIAGVRTVYLMEKPSFIKPICYSFRNGLQGKSAIQLQNTY